MYNESSHKKHGSVHSLAKPPLQNKFEQIIPERRQKYIDKPSARGYTENEMSDELQPIKNPPKVKNKKNVALAPLDHSLQQRNLSVQPLGHQISLTTKANSGKHLDPLKFNPSPKDFRGRNNVNLGSIDHSRHLPDNNSVDHRPQLPSPQAGGGRMQLEPLK